MNEKKLLVKYLLSFEQPKTEGDNKLPSDPRSLIYSSTTLSLVLTKVGFNLKEIKIVGQLPSLYIGSTPLVIFLYAVFPYSVIIEFTV